MNEKTPLLRQIVSDWIVNGRPSSQAFRPFKADHLSTYDGDMISAEGAYRHYVEHGNKSAGVAFVLAGEFRNEGLSIVEDRIPYKEHISVDYSGISESQRKNISKRLADISFGHGWAFRPE